MTGHGLLLRPQNLLKGGCPPAGSACDGQPFRNSCSEATNLSRFCPGRLGALTGQLSDSKADDLTPGIYIERISDRSPGLVPGLKSQYRTCADSRQLYKRLYEQGGVGWDAVKQTLPEGYNVSEAVAPEPAWEKEGVGKQVEKEVFFGNRYALFQHRNRYEISEPERCGLIRHQDLVIDIDNGSDRYLVTLKDRKEVKATSGVSNIPLAQQYESHQVQQMQSPQTIHGKAGPALEKMGKEERVARLLSLLFSDTETKRAPGVSLSYDPKLTDKIKRGMCYEESPASSADMPKAHDEHVVAGQPCDIIAAKKLNTRLWYWHRMHHYPGKLDRPIILKSEVLDRKQQTVGVEEAVTFQLLPEIDSSVFELDESLRK